MKNIKRDSDNWRKVYGVKNPYYYLNGNKVFVSNKKEIRNFTLGREIRIRTLISHVLLQKNRT